MTWTRSLARWSKIRTETGQRSKQKSSVSGANAPRLRMITLHASVSGRTKFSEAACRKQVGILGLILIRLTERWRLAGATRERGCAAAQLQPLSPPFLTLVSPRWSNRLGH